VLNSFGWGLFAFLGSLATSFINVHYIAELNFFVSVINIIGLMFGSPLFAVLFSKGVELEEKWYSLPFSFALKLL
ncbi:uncharacterized protein LY89DRAFT_603774, partial [Mollisia scopiformis]